MDNTAPPIPPGRIRQLASHEEILTFDRALRDQLKMANASPFLGQYDLPKFIENGIDAMLCTDSPARSLLSLLRAAPAATVCFIARIASIKAGSESFGEFYPHLEKRLDQKLTGPERNELGTAFREACNRLLLPAPPWQPDGDSSWKWRREYLMQAGVIYSDLDALAIAALDLEDRLGLPDGFDLEEVRAWQYELAETSLQGHKLLRQLLDLDADGWHSSTISRLRRGERGVTQFETALATAIERAAASPRSNTSTSGQLRPAIRLEGGQVILRTPARAGARWQIDAGWSIPIEMAPDQEIELPIADSIRWRTTEREDDWHALPVWSGAAMLLFDASSGRFLRRVTVGSSCEIDSSEVALVSREKIDGSEFECQSADGQLWLTVLKLTGKPIRIGHWIEIRARPALRWMSQPELILEGKGVFGSAGAVISAELSTEQVGSWGRTFELLVRLRGDASARFPFEFSDPENPRAFIDPSKFDVGNFDLISAALVQSGTERALMSAPGVWFWPGLVSFDGTRFIGPPPDNLDLRNCRGVQPDQDGISLTIEADRLAHLAFKTGGRNLCFRLPRQGVALELEEQGQWRPILPGQRITDDGRPRRLRIWSGDASAALQIGTQIVRSAFTGSGHRTVTLNGLAAANSIKIRYWRSGNESDAIELLSIVKAATPVDIELLREGGGPVLRVQMDEDIEQFEFVGFDLMSGDSISLSGPENGVVARDERGSWRIRPAHGALREGAWLLELQARVRGEDHARPVRTLRGDRLAILVPTLRKYGVVQLSDMEIPGPAEYRNHFVRLSAAVTRLWSREVWEQKGGLYQVADAWAKVGKRLALAFDREDHEALLRGAGQAVPFDSPPSWVPLLHPIEVAPHLFSGSLNFIHDVLVDADDDGCRGLAESLNGDPLDGFRHQEALRRFETRLAAAGGGEEGLNLIRRGRLTGLADKCVKAIQTRNIPQDVRDLLNAHAHEDELIHRAPFLATFIARQTRLSTNPNVPLVAPILDDPQGEAAMFLRLAPELVGLHLKLWADLKS